MKITLLEPTLVFGPYSMKKFGNPGTAMPRYAYAPSRHVSRSVAAPSPVDLDLAKVVGRGVTGGTHHDVDVELSAVLR